MIDYELGAVGPISSSASIRLMTWGRMGSMSLPGSVQDTKTCFLVRLARIEARRSLASSNPPKSNVDDAGSGIFFFFSFTLVLETAGVGRDCYPLAWRRNGERLEQIRGAHPHKQAVGEPCHLDVDRRLYTTGKDRTLEYNRTAYLEPRLLERSHGDLRREDGGHRAPAPVSE